MYTASFQLTFKYTLTWKNIECIIGIATRSLGNEHSRITALDDKFSSSLSVYQGGKMTFFEYILHFLIFSTSKISVNFFYQQN